MTVITLADPLRDDTPLIYVNKAFTQLTGYSKEESLGKNCRFLQGSATERADIDTLRSGIENDGKASCCLLNYRADGTAFHNMLFVSTLEMGDDRRFLLGSQFEFESKFLPYNVKSNREQPSDLENEFLQSRSMHGKAMISALEMQAQGAIMMVQSYLRMLSKGSDLTPGA